MGNLLSKFKKSAKKAVLPLVLLSSLGGLLYHAETFNKRQEEHRSKQWNANVNVADSTMKNIKGADSVMSFGEAENFFNYLKSHPQVKDYYNAKLDSTERIEIEGYSTIRDIRDRGAISILARSSTGRGHYFFFVDRDILKGYDSNKTYSLSENN